MSAPSLSEMSEIPSGDCPSTGGSSKGVNLFLMRQKLIAEAEAEAEANRADGPNQDDHTDGRPEMSTDTSPHTHSYIPYSPTKHQHSEGESPSIPKLRSSDVLEDPGRDDSVSSKSKGANLFLARQKKIAEQMEREEAERKIAEEEKRTAEEAARVQEEQRLREEAEKKKFDEIKRKEQERLAVLRAKEEEARKIAEAKARARAARFKPAPEREHLEPVAPWVKKNK